MKKSSQLFYWIIIFLTTIDVLLLAYSLFYPADSSTLFVVRSFDLIVCIILWAEFIYSLMHAEDKRQFMRENAISILGMLPVDFFFLRALRLVKLVQLIKLVVLLRDSERYITKFFKQTFLDKIILIAIIFIFTVTVLFRIFNPDVDNIKDALWYIVVSMTNTGYGDIVPQTVSGRLLGMATMVGGIMIFATFTAVISSIYVSKINQDNRDALESKIDDLNSKIEKLNKKIDEMNEK